MSLGAHAPAAPARAPALAGPYRGLLPFAEDDAPYFFGRDGDRDIILANLIASRLTLLYAPSGVGKTSVLLAGVYHGLLAQTRANVRAGRGPEYLPVVVRRWTGDPLRAIDEAVRDASDRFMGGKPAPADSHLVDRLFAWSQQTDATLLLILDQFEEFLLYHGDAWGRGEPASELAQVLSARDAPISVLLGLREDALASLDRFKGRVPHLFENYLRLTHLDAAAARQAIAGPVERWNEDHPDEPWEIEPALVDTVLEEAETDPSTLGAGGAGVETSFLQLVMTRLWERERQRGSRRLRLETLQSLGGARKLVETHLDVRMRALERRQRNIAAAVFQQMVTPSGAKVARSLDDLAGLTGIDEQQIERVLETLARGEWLIVRRVTERGTAGPPSYEIFHDVLARAVLEWRTRHEEGRRHARQLRIGLLAAVVVLVAVAVVVVVVGKERQARAGEQAARAGQLAASARALLGVDPVEAVETAAEAVAIRGDLPATVGALRAALAQADPQVEIDDGRGPVESFRVSPDGRQLASAGDGQVRIWTQLHPTRPVRLRAPGVQSVAFSPDSRRLATGGDDILVWRVRGGKPVRLSGRDSKLVRWSPRGETLISLGRRDATVWDLQQSIPKAVGRANGVVWSPGGSRFATTTRRGRVHVWDAGGQRLASLPGRGRVRQLAFTDDGSRVLAARRDGTVSVLEAKGCRAHGLGDLSVTHAAFSADGTRVALGAADGIRVLKVKRCEQTFLPTPPQAPLDALTMSRDGDTVVAAGADGAARVWDVPSQTLLATLLGGWEEHARLALRPAADGGQVVLAAGDDGRIREWKVAAIPVVHVRPRRLQAVAFDAASRSLLTATSQEVRIREVGPVIQGGRRLGPRTRASQAAFSARGDLVAVVTPPDRSLRVRSVGASRWRRLGQPGSGTDVTSLAFNLDGRRLVTAHRDGAARVWDTRTGRSRVLRPVGPGKSRRPSAAFVQNSVAVVDGGVRMYDLATNHPTPLQTAGHRHAGDGERTAVAAEGDRLAAAPAGSLPTIWDLAQPARSWQLRGVRAVTALAFARGGHVLATAGEDGLRLWDGASGQPLVKLAASPFDAVAFSHDGRWVVARSRQAGAQVFPCPACGDREALRRAAMTLTGANPLGGLAPLPAPRSDTRLQHQPEPADPDPGVDGGFYAPEAFDPSGAPMPAAVAPPKQRAEPPDSSGAPATDTAPVPTATPQMAPVTQVPAEPDPAPTAETGETVEG